jgi:hypothetical protein
MTRITDARMNAIAQDMSADLEPVDRGPLTVPAELTDDATWIAFDLARNVDKGPRLAQRDADIAMDLQVQYQGCIGGLPE